VNLGHDADTVGAVTGQLAGAFYGVDGIPRNWLLNVAQGAELARVADELTALRSCPVIVTRFEEDAEFGPRPRPEQMVEVPAVTTRRRWFRRR
jgi:hypothetical protein